MNTSRTALYRHYDAVSNLLYIGISLSATYRLRQHKSSTQWANDAVRMETEWFDTRKEAEAAEIAAIKNEKPKFNVTHNVEPKLGQKLKVKVIGVSTRKFEELTLEEKRIIWACIALKNDPKEQAYLTCNSWNDKVDFITQFVITDVYFSKLFGIPMDNSKTYLRQAAKTLSKGIKVIESFNETTNFIYHKTGWIVITGLVGAVFGNDDSGTRCISINFTQGLLEQVQNQQQATA